MNELCFIFAQFSLPGFEIRPHFLYILNVLFCIILFHDFKMVHFYFYC